MITPEQLDYLEHLDQGASPAPWGRAHDDYPNHPCKCGQIWSQEELLFAPVRSLDDECAARPASWWLSRLAYLKHSITMCAELPGGVDFLDVRNLAVARGWQADDFSLPGRIILGNNPKFPLRQIILPMDEKADDYSESMDVALSKLIELEKLNDPAAWSDKTDDPRVADGRLLVESRNALKGLIAAAREAIMLRESMKKVAWILQSTMDDEDADTDDLLSAMRAAIYEATRNPS